jgi:hypothetical protein
MTQHRYDGRMSKKAPKNPKGYEPAEQLPACCVPACLKMVFARHGWKPRLSQEDIGRQLGLTIRPDMKKHFSDKVEARRTPPPSGYGTRTNQERYSLGTAFRKWRVPLSVEFRFVDTIRDEKELGRVLRKLAKDDTKDVLMCVQSGSLDGDPWPGSGHVVLLSDAGKNKAHYVEPGDAAINSVDYDTLHEGMKSWGPKLWAGLWILSRA